MAEAGGEPLRHAAPGHADAEGGDEPVERLRLRRGDVADQGPGGGLGEPVKTDKVVDSEIGEVAGQVGADDCGDRAGPFDVEGVAGAGVDEERSGSGGAG